jgi:hypothetical protein
MTLSTPTPHVDVPQNGRDQELIIIWVSTVGISEEPIEGIRDASNPDSNYQATTKR